MFFRGESQRLDLFRSLRVDGAPTKPVLWGTVGDVPLSSWVKSASLGKNRFYFLQCFFLFVSGIDHDMIKFISQ